MATEKELDLVKISPMAKPPVCKIMDYGKYLFEASKKAKESRKTQRVAAIKEIRFFPNIGENDLNTKVQNAVKFLKMGDKVKIVVRFRGREVTHSSIGMNLLLKFVDLVSEYGVPESRPKLEGKTMTMFVAPKKN
jgi:translation initiation factor IF-3